MNKIIKFDHLSVGTSINRKNHNETSTNNITYTINIKHIKVGLSISNNQNGEQGQLQADETDNYFLSSNRFSSQQATFICE